MFRKVAQQSLKKNTGIYSYGGLLEFSWPKKNVVGEYLWKDVEKQQWFEPGQWPRHSLLREAEALPSAPGRAGSAGSGTGLAANWPPGLSVAWLLWTSANSSVKQKLVPSPSS